MNLNLTLLAELGLSDIKLALQSSEKQFVFQHFTLAYLFPPTTTLPLRDGKPGTPGGLGLPQQTGPVGSVVHELLEYTPCLASLTKKPLPLTIEP